MAIAFNSSKCKVLYFGANNTEFMGTRMQGHREFPFGNSREFPGIADPQNSRREFPGISEILAGITGNFASFVFFSERELKFMFAICHRASVCRLSSVVCDVGAPYSDD